MTKPNDVVPLEEIHFLETNDPTVCALGFIDVNKRVFHAAVNSSGLAAVVGKFLDQARHPKFAAASLQGARIQRCHIDATRLELTSGRSPSEAAVILTIGCVEVAAFVPLDEVMRACAELVARLDQPSPDRKH